MLKFKTKQMGRGGEVTLDWSGALKGDENRVHADGRRRPGPASGIYAETQ
jgi:hypothetical protein